MYFNFIEKCHRLRVLIQCSTSICVPGRCVPSSFVFSNTLYEQLLVSSFRPLFLKYFKISPQKKFQLCFAWQKNSIFQISLQYLEIWRAEKRDIELYIYLYLCLLCVLSLENRPRPNIFTGWFKRCYHMCTENTIQYLIFLYHRFCQDCRIVIVNSKLHYQTKHLHGQLAFIFINAAINNKSGKIRKLPKQTF